MMAPNDGLITPPPELRKQWIDESPNISLDGHTRIGTDWDAVMDKAARWGPTWSWRRAVSGFKSFTNWKPGCKKT